MVSFLTPLWLVDLTSQELCKHKAAMRVIAFATYVSFPTQPRNSTLHDGSNMFLGFATMPLALWATQFRLFIDCI